MFKKLFFLLVILLAASQALAGAQDVDPQVRADSVELHVNQYAPVFGDEISLSYGRASLVGVAMTFGAALGAAFTFGLARPHSLHLSGAIGAEYFHYFNEHFAVGGTAVIENAGIDWDTYNGKDSSGNSVYSPGSSNNQWFFTMLPGVKYRWLCRPGFGMYSKACVGGMMSYTPSYVTMKKTTNKDTGAESVETNVYEAKTGWSYALQVSPIGMEWGKSSWLGYTEVGVGMQGFIVAGVRYRF